MASSATPELDECIGFAVTLHESMLQLSKSAMSAKYIKDLRHGRPLTEKPRIYRSTPYDLSESEEDRY
jgi:hypothetical protein